MFNSTKTFTTFTTETFCLILKFKMFLYIVARKRYCKNVRFVVNPFMLKKPKLSSDKGLTIIKANIKLTGKEI